MWAMKKLFFQISENFVRHDVFTLSAALAFYGALSAAPLLILIIAIVGVIGFESQHALISYAQMAMGPEASQIVEIIVNNANKNIQLQSAAKFFAAVFFFFSAGGVFVQLQYSMNVIWDTKPLESTKEELWNWLKKRFLSVLFVLVLAVITLVSLLISAVLSFLFKDTHFMLKLLNFVVTFVIFTVGFYAIFRYLPDEKTDRKTCWNGALITSALFISGKDVIAKYLGTSALASAYGSAGSLLILLMWFYYSAMILFLGAEITRILQLRRIHVSTDENPLLPNKT